MKHKVLELYSGIGGMHCAWKDSGLQGEIIAAVDINTVANSVYKKNFPEINLIARNIQSITVKEINKMDVNVILMSPPCQPFTRNGKYLDAEDKRADSFLYILSILQELYTIEYILLENVKGFECSKVRNLFIEKLVECNFKYQEFLLCPSKVGIPNSRLRYYCLARRSFWDFPTTVEIKYELSGEVKEPFPLREIIDSNELESFILQDKFLKWGKVLDICNKESRRSCCFTKAYSHYIDGTGSVFTEASLDKVKECYEEANRYPPGSAEFIENLRSLKLRLFTPKEVLAIMAFPNDYEFPDNITNKQCYRLLGNSVNVKVISELLKILFS
ncbi:tRNA (cytosine(38)-C(5))-methyltransferase [Leptidea sinapis]|uniref:tRNA (cytosine(38)-C(5))-methyltransferase n=1 Tax=Leptidea sinapis TaxID=189913 RepID=UPI00212A283F|nr:tRNA (cytosine(38)-C(5))-methyltransferase [Leptidea sinapis]